MSHESHSDLSEVAILLRNHIPTWMNDVRHCIPPRASAQRDVAVLSFVQFLIDDAIRLQAELGESKELLRHADDIRRHINDILLGWPKKHVYMYFRDKNN
jgi:hypothetical protein